MKAVNRGLLGKSIMFLLSSVFGKIRSRVVFHWVQVAETSDRPVVLRM